MKFFGKLQQSVGKGGEGTFVGGPVQAPAWPVARVGVQRGLRDADVSGWGAAGCRRAEAMVTVQLSAQRWFWASWLCLARCAALPAVPAAAEVGSTELVTVRGGRVSAPF